MTSSFLQESPAGPGPGRLPSVSSAGLVAPPTEAGEPAGFTLARLSLVLVLILFAAHLLPIGAAPAWGLLAAATVRVLAGSTSWPTVVAGAGTTWLLGTGFLSGARGELTFGAADQRHAAVLVVAALVALAVRLRARSVQRRG